LDCLIVELFNCWIVVCPAEKLYGATAAQFISRNEIHSCRWSYIGPFSNLLVFKSGFCWKL